VPVSKTGGCRFDSCLACLKEGQRRLFGRRFSLTTKEYQVAEKSEKKEGKIKRWWRETIGELRKVSWPSMPEAWRLTKIVLIVMVVMSLVLGLLDLVFSKLITLIIT
jgi:preprotein translocase subunit SecE